MTKYAVVRCTYVELCNAKGEQAYTLCSKDVPAGAAPLAIENMPELTELEARIVRNYLRWKNGKISEKQFVDATGAVMNYSKPTVIIDGNAMSIDYILQRATTRVYLTADGMDIISKLSGEQRAYQLSTQDLYVLCPFVRVLEDVSVETDEPDEQEPEPEPTQQGSGVLGKVLLAVLGWALFN